MKKILTKMNDFDEGQLLYNEWLVTNGLSGFACGSLSGAPMRKYHSLLNASLPSPYGRTIMLNYVADTLILPDKREINLSFMRYRPEKQNTLLYPVEFRLENGLPIWLYDIEGILLEKTLLLVHRQNTLHMSYKIKSDHEGIELRWKPFFHFRANEQSVDVQIPNEAYTVHATDSQYEVECPNFPLLKLFNTSRTPFIIQKELLEDVYYELEEERGYPCVGSLTSPGHYLSPLKPNEWLTFIASTESWKMIFALSPKDAWMTENLRKRSLLKTAGSNAKTSLTTNLILAADQFITIPTTRFEDMIRLQAAGEEIRSVIAGYPWFTEWGRDAMISLEGLTLVTGRYREAHSILHTFAHYISDGLIPNMFPDGENVGIYNTVDATLWYFHAIERYISFTKDEEILDFLLPKLENILHHHIKGTKFGIRMDSDGLLTQGSPGVQLTWMDAKVGDWVVTPRRGKAVEINALWYNALKLYSEWANNSHFANIAERCYETFNQKFWYEEGHYLYDVIEGESEKDAALRPNQLFAISLKHPILKQERWKVVLEAVQKDLYTPFGLRTLSPQHPDYKDTYHGDITMRDAAYHQGSIWPWLLGAYIDVWLKVYPSDLDSVQKILQALESHVYKHCLGTIGEIFDASPPYKARGCFAQAWSVAEVLRCLVKIQAATEQS